MWYSTEQQNKSNKPQHSGMLAVGHTCCIMKEVAMEEQTDTLQHSKLRALKLALYPGQKKRLKASKPNYTTGFWTQIKETKFDDYNYCKSCLNGDTWESNSTIMHLFKLIIIPMFLCNHFRTSWPQLWWPSAADLHSTRLFCSGVPVSTTLLWVLMAFIALEILEPSLRRMCPSSQTTKSGPERKNNIRFHEQRHDT